MILLVVHAGDPAVDREEGSLQAPSHRSVKLLTVILRHLKYDHSWVTDVVVLRNTGIINLLYKYIFLLLIMPTSKQFLKT